MRMLLVEDDDLVVEALVPALHRYGFAVDRVAESGSALDRLDGADVVLLDLRLPDGDGIDLCCRIREISDVPVIVVSASGDVRDRERGLRCGADDYLVKPFDERELVAAVHVALARRTEEPTTSPDGEVIGVGDVEIDVRRRAVTVAGAPISLSGKQFRLLALVAQAGGAVCTRERIMTEVWPEVPADAPIPLDDEIGALRTAVGRPWVVATVSAVGYRLGRPPARTAD